MAKEQSEQFKREITGLKTDIKQAQERMIKQNRTHKMQIDKER